jgi:hypothetical protein
LKLLTNDRNESLIDDKEEEPQRVELSPIENHASHRAYNVSARHQAVAGHEKHDCKCGITLAPFSSEHNNCLGVEKHKREKTTESL